MRRIHWLSGTQPYFANEAEVRTTINSFDTGSSAGLDGLRPAHLKDLTSRSAGEAGVRLITALTALVNMALSGELPRSARAAFFGAALTALRKSDGGVRPIAVGCTYRRLAAKLALRPLSAEVGEQLRPTQLGYVQQVISAATAPFNCWYLDDGTLGGKVSTICADLKELTTDMAKIGLDINPAKCEIILPSTATDEQRVSAVGKIHQLLPRAPVVPDAELTVLGAPITDTAARAVMAKKMEELDLMIERLHHLDAHSAFFLLCNCLWLPKLQYLLRAAPLYEQPDLLQMIDKKLKSSLAGLTNVRFDDASWEQAVLPVSAGRHPRHTALNDVLRRALLSANIPALLEPIGLDRGDGKRPDGMTLYPFSSGMSLVWDATCVSTFADCNIASAAVAAGQAARDAEVRKRYKYADLAQRYRFEPVAFETGGACGPGTRTLIRELGARLTAASGDKRETEWLWQRLSIAVMRGNATSVLLTSGLLPQQVNTTTNTASVKPPAVALATSPAAEAAKSLAGGAPASVPTPTSSYSSGKSYQNDDSGSRWRSSPRRSSSPLRARENELPSPRWLSDVSRRGGGSPHPPKARRPRPSRSNATLQSLLGLRPFLSEMVSLISDPGVSDQCRTLRAVAKLMVLRQKALSKSVFSHLNDLRDVFAEIDPAFRGIEMQDANEFLLRLLDTLKEEIDAQRPTDNPVRDNFQYQTIESYMCTKCHETVLKQQENISWFVSVPRHQGTEAPTLLDALRLCMRPDRRELLCQHCRHDECRYPAATAGLPESAAVGSPVTAGAAAPRPMSATGAEPPPLPPAQAELVAQDADPESNPARTREDRELKEAMMRSLEEGAPADASEQVHFPKSCVEDDQSLCSTDLAGDFTYRLVSVVSHHGGNTHSGHYVSDVYSVDRDRWYHYDDRRVSCVDEAEVLGEGHQRNGYIFFYLHKDLCNQAVSVEGAGGAL
ncbi:Ubiquitin carboxyl-terminal hydrolase 37 [Amphibalanus amphitrite]|uniref:Ubiquitin carboxyl-terminal hydrolase 37 n=1 Tax=Amphibalanus amphitrite TaxID=1232801 RepID=A0A6A4W685_AMPAM|nr:Ubiquitin carboxyl-terminal hydrolase 37 [Amphibalanus amphitrite]